jgi:cell division septum initiation protein DivIVA
MTTPQPDHITRPDFSVSVRGYDRTQVDAYFGRLVEWLADAENRAMEAERSREFVTRENSDLRATVTMLEQRTGLPAPQSMGAFSERMRQLMESALEAAHELRAEAEREAQERRESALIAADRTLAAAREEAEEVVDGARRAQRAIEESIDELRVARVEAIEALVDLQQRIATTIGLPQPSVDGESGGEVDVAETTVLPAVTPERGDAGALPAPEAGREDVVTPTGGVLVTAAPTTVVPVVGPDADRNAAATRRKRSA